MSVLSKAHQVWYLQGVSPGGKGQGGDTGTNPTPVLCTDLMHTRLCAPRWRNSLLFVIYLLPASEAADGKAELAKAAFTQPLC